MTFRRLLSKFALNKGPKGPKSEYLELAMLRRSIAELFGWHAEQGHVALRGFADRENGKSGIGLWPRNLASDLRRAFIRLLIGNPRALTSKEDVTEASRPQTVGAEIINICNADCTFCGYGKGDDGKAADPRKKQKLNREVFRHLLKLFSEAGGGNFSLSPILGEISAHPGWLELVKEARSFPNITGVSCFTNAILLDRFGYDKIIRSGLTAISISTSLGSPEQYSRLYGVDEYTRVVKNVLGMLKENHRLGNPVALSLLLRIDKPYEQFFASPLYEEICRYLPKSSVVILDDFWDDFHGLIEPEGLPAGHRFKANLANKTAPCYAMFRKLQVMTDGTLQACSCRVEPELWAGNILDHDTLNSAWKDPGLERLRKGWFGGEIPACCRTCSHYMPYTNLYSGPLDAAKSALRRIATKAGFHRVQIADGGPDYE